uniref:Uncharacterized protein n=1 Tax=Romanomermis culicivorax TaxID=13658 RepID=A0A915JX86_ROMCU
MIPEDRCMMLQDFNGRNYKLALKRTTVISDEILELSKGECGKGTMACELIVNSISSLFCINSATLADWRLIFPSRHELARRPLHGEEELVMFALSNKASLKLRKELMQLKDISSGTYDY